MIYDMILILIFDFGFGDLNTITAISFDILTSIGADDSGYT